MANPLQRYPSIVLIAEKEIKGTRVS